MTPNFVVWIVICYLSGFCWSRYITTESCQFTNLVLILIVLTSECLCPVSGILSSWYPCLCPRLSEDQSWLSRSRSGTCLSLRWWLLATGTPGPHWPRHGLSLVTWPHLWPLIGQIWPSASQVLLSSLVSGWLCGRHLAPRRPPGVCLNTRSESHDWGERGRILFYEEYTLIMRPRDLDQHQTLRSQGEADNTIYGSGVLCGSGSEKLWILDHREEEHSISSFQDDYELSKSWNRSLKQTKKLSSFLSLHLQFGTDEK